LQGWGGGLGGEHFDGFGFLGCDRVEGFEFLVGVEVEAQGQNDAIGVVAEADDQGKELGELGFQGGQGAQDETGGGAALTSAIDPDSELFNPFPVFLVVREPALFQGLTQVLNIHTPEP